MKNGFLPGINESLPSFAVDFQCHEKAFYPFDDEISDAVDDIVRGSRLCKKIGMSYEFLARQLPMPMLRPALTVDEARTRLGLDVGKDERFDHNGTRYFCVNARSSRYVVPAPEIGVICTRLDSSKGEINPCYDLVRYGFKNGCIILETPCDGNGPMDSRLSSDALAVVAHAFANAILASILERWLLGSPFFHRLRNRGMALLHWHGFLPENDMPFGYFAHASSTPQSGANVLEGKLELLHRGAETALYHQQGDIHIERQHGTTVTCASLDIFLRCLNSKWQLREGFDAIHR